MAKTNAIFAMKINTICVITIFVITLCLGSNAQQFTPIFNISSIPPDTRAGWCQQQTSWCVNLCNDEQNIVETNDCDPDSLSYNCICSNGFKPNSTEYTLPVPYYICTTNVQTCQSKCAPADSSCVNQCNQNCTATPHSPKYNVTFSTALSSPTSSSSSSSSGSSSPTPSQNILSSASSISASFIVFLAVAFSMSVRL